jgi:uncharacterized protein with ACT and thioredoxin-like domain
VDLKTYACYVDLFNQGDEEALFDKFYTEDAVMQTSDRYLKGRELVEFLKEAHDGVREILRPQIVVTDGDHLMAEVDIDFIAEADRPLFPIQPLKQGEKITVKFFCVYTCQGDRISYLKTSRWPVGWGLSRDGSLFS